MKANWYKCSAFRAALASVLLLASTPFNASADTSAPRWDPILPVAGPADDATMAEAELVLRDTFTFQGVQGVAARRAEGGFDWDDQGPRDDPEWAWFFNRHGCFASLTQAYQRTGDNRYAEFIFASLDDWIRQHPAPGRMSFSAAWRPLEAARRILDSWTLVYLKLGDHPAFTPERRAHFLAGVHAHGEQLRHHHALYGNHLITEMLALAQLSLVFPADADAEEWLHYSLDQLERTYADQVYPDGAHTELAAHYQRVVALNYQRLLTLLDAAGRTAQADAWRSRVQRMWAYLSAVMQPDHGNPLNNDSDQENLMDLLRSNAPDLAVEPTATRWLPYSGQAVFRSVGPDTHSVLWGFFDAGPRGTDHDHADRLHLSVSVGAREFLVDNGRYTYAPGPWRDYFAGPTGHNVVLFDGQGSDQGPAKVAAPDSLGRFFRQGDLEIAYGDTSFSTAENARAGDWRRLVIHVRNQGWIVVDRIIAFQPASLSTLWHWDPVCDALPADSGTGQIIRHGAGSLRLRVVSSTVGGEWQVVRGANHPVQGWSSDRINFKTPASCTLYTQRVGKPVTNVWLIAPNDERPQATALDVAFAPDGKLVVRARYAKADLELRLDPEQPERTLSSRSRPRGGEGAGE